MLAVVCRALTGLDGLSIEELPTPEPGPGEVRIRVRAAGLNFADTLIISGRYQERPALPFVPGMEIAGTIEACGEGVAGFAAGERVLATLGHGGFAQAAVTAADNVVRLPDAVDDVAAASLPIAYGTAYGALCWSGRLQAGETVMVHGAGGGVGLAAVECGHVLGATVIATARGAAHLEAASAHGADHLIDTSTADMREHALELTGGRGVDVIFDPIGGELFTASLRALAWEGRILVIGFASGEIPQIPANRLLLKNAGAIGFHWGGWRRHDPARVRAALDQLLRWCAEGRIRPHASDVLPLAQARDALELLLARRSTGKVVLRMEE
jgi:NADPH2:quinone reductase